MLKYVNGRMSFIHSVFKCVRTVSCEKQGWGFRRGYLMLTELTDSLRGLGGWTLTSTNAPPGTSVCGETNIPEQLAGQLRPPEREGYRVDAVLPLLH